MSSNLELQAWQMVAPGEPLRRVSQTLALDGLGPQEAVVEVAGCGVCHTDLGYLYDGVRTRRALPLTLGHEIAGRVVAAGSGAAHLVGRAVVVPAVTPCGACGACLAGRGAICAAQYFPGNDGDGGFATHVRVPARGLCPVDEARLAARGLDLADLAVVADAGTTPYQAIVNAGGVGPGDLVVFVGAGGVGTFGVQIAAALGATVVALDVNPTRLERLTEGALPHGAALALDARGEPREIRKRIEGLCADRGLRKTGWRIFETSGHPAGQTLAYGLLGYGAHLGVVGFTLEKVSVRLSNLMAFDATARGTWGCLPEHYPAVVDLVLDGRVQLTPFVERRPMSRVGETFDDLRAHRLDRRPVLIPDF